MAYVASWVPAQWIDSIHQNSVYFVVPLKGLFEKCPVFWLHLKNRYSTCTHGQTKVKIRDIGLQSDSRAEHTALRLVIFSEAKRELFVKLR